MKTVQLLYSYLLVEKPFTLESQPSAPTKEKRFAYNLYLDLIYLMNRLAHEITGKNKKYPLAETRFIIKTESDEHIRSLKIKYETSHFPFIAVESLLSDNIKDSLLFKEFEKNRTEGLSTDSFWENVFNNIIILNPALNEIIRNLPGYSLSGVERMKNIMESTFKSFNETKDNVSDALKTLELSMQKARDLYMRLLALPVELTTLRMEELENNRRKFLATSEDLNPNMRFVNNLVVKEIENNRVFNEYVEKNHLSWRNEDPELLQLLLKAVLQSEIYNSYIEGRGNDIETDVEFWRNVIIEVILTNKDFLEFLENKSVFWNDDLEIMASFVLKTFKRLENVQTKETAVLPMYKDGEKGKDACFGADLLNLAVKNKDVYRNYIDSALIHEKWDSDRLAFMDIVITICALAEIINYADIPLQVSINEYIEIAKSYSSEKSGQFVNGLLASILPKLREEGIIHK